MHGCDTHPHSNGGPPAVSPALAAILAFSRVSQHSSSFVFGGKMGMLGWLRIHYGNSSRFETCLLFYTMESNVFRAR